MHTNTSLAQDALAFTLHPEAESAAKAGIQTVYLGSKPRSRTEGRRERNREEGKTNTRMHYKVGHLRR